MKSSMFAMSLRVAHDAKPAEVRKRCLRMHGTTLAARGHDSLRHAAGGGGAGASANGDHHG